MWNSAGEYLRSVLKWWWIVAIGSILPLAEMVKELVQRLSGNQPFDIPTWLWLTSIILSLFIAQFLVFHKVRVEKGNLKRKLEERNIALNTPDLMVGANTKSISTYDYYARAFQNRDEGDRKLILNVVLNPTRDIVMDSLAIELWGEKFEIQTLDMSDFAEPLAPMLYRDISHIEGYADIPKQSAINTRAARVVALANGIEWFSEPFSINFEVSSD